MVKKENENLLKEKIFQVFLKCRNEASHDRRQVYFGQLCAKIYLWCKDYLSFNIDDLRMEIVNVVMRITKEENRVNVPQDKEGFFKYLLVSLKTEKIEYYRKNEAGIIDISKNKKYKFKKTEEDIIKMKAASSYRKLTEKNRSKYILKWLKSETVKNNNIKKKKNVSSLSFDNEEEYEINSFNKIIFDSNSNYTGDKFEKLQINLKREIIREAVKITLDKKHENVRNCYRALFTLFCIETTGDNDIEWLCPVFDPKIFEMHKNKNDKPALNKVYMDYHPGVKESNASVLASKMLKDFTDELKSFLKKTSPDFFS